LGGLFFDTGLLKSYDAAMRYLFLITFFTFGLLFFADNTVAQTAAVQGEWAASMNTPGGARPFGLVFKVEGEKLTGSVKRSSGDVPLTGSIKGKDISFAYTINYNGNDLTLSFTGKVDGDSIAGTVSFGGNAEDTWSAKRAPAAKPK
jgi:hypothetical protein